MPADEALRFLLLAMPADGEWMPGRGRHYAIIVALITARSPLIEETYDLTSVSWLVRLTDRGIALSRAIIEADGV
jgi:hypothetical protein